VVPHRPVRLRPADRVWVEGNVCLVS
jgi:hypothetical protein